MTEDLLQESDDPEQADPNKNYLEELVGEGKKFKSQEDLARGKFESDSYIKILERRLDTITDDYKSLREDYNSRAKLEDIAKQLSTSQQQSSNDDTQVNDAHKPTIDLDEIKKLVRSELQDSDSAKRQRENADFVKDKLVRHYGENYHSAVKKQLAELGLSEEEFNETARTKPKMLTRLLGVDQEPTRETFTAPPRSVERANAFKPSTQKRTWSYYQDLKKKDPSIWLDKKTAIQMQKDAIDLGEAFMDGDYHKYN